MRNQFLALVTLVAWLGHGSGLPAAGPQKVASIEGITEYRLENGLQLLLFPDVSQPTVTVNLTIFVGSRHEGYGEAGMAHLLEHMVFKGTPLHPDVPKSLQERGARFNGTTWLDRTNYFETMPASDENLEFAVRLEADRMVNSYIKGEDLASEMTVVRNEFEMGENSPSNILEQRMTAVAFEWHNYGQSTIGNRSDIERVPVPKLRDFYRRFYQPDNAMVVVAGKFDEAKALDYVEKYFGTLPRPARELDRTYTEEPAQDGEREVTLRRVGDVGMVGVAYHIPAGPHPEYAAVEVLSYILATEPAGRLYKALVETKQATSIVGMSYPLHDPGLLLMMAEVGKGDSQEVVRDTLIGVIEKIGTDGVTDEEVTRVKQQILSQRERSLGNTSSVAVELSEWAAQGDWRLFFLHRDRIEQVTASGVQVVAAKYLQQNNRTLGRFIPTAEAQRIAVSATPKVESMVKDYKGRATVAAGEQFNPSPAIVESRTSRLQLPGGLKVALLPKKTRNEAVQLQLTLRFGTPLTLRGKNAACSLLPELMTRGTKQLTYQQLKDALDKNRATLTGSGSAGQANFSVETQRSQLPQVLDLLRQVLREPALPQEEVEVLRREELAQLEQAKTDPQYLASRLYSKTTSPYPQDDVRYPPSIEEEIGRYTAVKWEHIQQLYADYLGSQHGELVLVGDFDPAEVGPRIEAMFEAWDASQPYERLAQTAFTDVPGAQHQVLTPDKENAVFFGGMSLALKDSDPDYAGLILGNFILGGGSLSSRLGDRVRQKEGLSYGIGSMFVASSRDPAARFAMFAISNPDNSPKVVAAIREELDLLLSKGITDEELERAKKGYLESQNVSRANDKSLARTLSETLYSERTMVYYLELENQVRDLTREQVEAALRRHLDLKRLVIITAGDFERAAKPEK